VPQVTVQGSPLGWDDTVTGSAVGAFVEHLPRRLVQQNVPWPGLGVNQDEWVGSDSLRGMGAFF